MKTLYKPKQYGRKGNVFPKVQMPNIQRNISNSPDTPEIAESTLKTAIFGRVGNAMGWIWIRVKEIAGRLIKCVDNLPSDGVMPMRRRRPSIEIDGEIIYLPRLYPDNPNLTTRQERVYCAKMDLWIEQYARYVLGSCTDADCHLCRLPRDERIWRIGSDQHLGMPAYPLPALPE